MGSKSEQRSSSANTSSSIGIGGDNNGYVVDGNNNSFTTTNTDYGAIESAGLLAGASFESVNNSSNNMAAIADSSIGAMSGVANNAFALTDNYFNTTTDFASDAISQNAGLVSEMTDFAAFSVSENAGLVSEMTNMSGLMLAESLASGERATANAAELINNSGQRNINAALQISEQGFMQNQMGADLAKSLFSTSQQASLVQQQDNNDALANGYKASMQFVEDFSRSDGADLAKTNLQTVGVLVGGLVVAAFVLKKKG
ncbi:hypothetical protein [Thalassotalea piscium]|uniref:Uncharacterized protein n=1 Tax=Thalassotalea piscium TaxID=1230533 RepID=A0A7X0NGG3_9GAMM|nr:hypothetical protein [Thalassotalea piscium]MBB6542856.1 hypothetical protein [Thalassotalea piscium]